MRKRQPDGKEIHAISFANVEVPVHIHYEYRRNARVAIAKDRVIIRIPKFLSKENKIKQINDFKQWAEKKFIQKPQLLPLKRKEYYSGKIISAGDKSFVLFLEFINSPKSRFRFSDGNIFIQLSSQLSEEEMEKVITRSLSNVMANEFSSWMHARLQVLNELNFPNKKFSSFKLKYMQTLWGNCSFDGKIQISTRLLLAPDEVIDYVLIHELAHMLVQNHSKNFWMLVQRAMPDYKKYVGWLREYGDVCDF